MRKTRPAELFIRSARESDYEELETLCARRLGEGYLNREDFEERLEYPALFLVADCGGKPVAAVTMTPESPESLATALKLPLSDILKAADGKPTIHFRTAIAAEEFEGMGLIRELLSQVIDNARRLGYGLILSPTWKYNGWVPAAGVQESLGFVSLGERDDLWVDQQGYICLFCHGPCRCKAVLYQLKL